VEDPSKAQPVLRPFSAMRRFAIDAGKHEKIAFAKDIGCIESYVLACSIQVTGAICAG